MRADQLIGLPQAAVDFLSQNEYVDPPCSCCRRPFPPKLVEIGQYEGFGKYPLYRHNLKDGRTADEFVQAEPWSSGPMIFLALRLSDGTSIEWPDAEIDAMVD